MPCHNHTFTQFYEFLISPLTGEKLVGYCQTCDHWFRVTNTQSPEILSMVDATTRKHLENKIAQGEANLVDLSSVPVLS